MQTRTRISRTTSLLISAVMLLTSVFSFSLTASADTDTPHTCTVEPAVLYADDYSECITGLYLYVDNPDNLALSLECAVYFGDDRTTPISGYDDWLHITAIESAESTGDSSDEASTRPAFVVDFRNPQNPDIFSADVAPTTPFLRAVTISDEVLYALSPSYSVVLHVTGGEADADGVYPLDLTTEYTYDADFVTFDLERPQKLISRLVQEEGRDGVLYTYCYLPESIRTILSYLKGEERSSFLSANGLSDAVFFMQYDFTTANVPTTYDPETESYTEIWGGEETLHPLSDSTLFLGEFTFASEQFRSMFAEGTFLEVVPENTGDASAASDPYYVIDAEDTTITTRMRFVLKLTCTDGSVRYCTSSFTDPFSCGASNSLVSEPSVITAPTLSTPTFEVAENGDTTLFFNAKNDHSVLETALWLLANNKNEISTEFDISINGGEWSPLTPTFAKEGDPLLGGEYALVLSDQKLNEYTYIRLRMRYVAEDIPLQSDFSDPVAFEKHPEDTVTEPIIVNTLPIYSDTTGQTGEVPFVCSVCGFCPAPYGVCLFLWIGAALLIVLLVVLVIALIPKKMPCPGCGHPNKRTDHVCVACGYRFVGNMPEIDTGEVFVPAEKQDPSFFEREHADMRTQAAVQNQNETAPDPMPEATPSVPMESQTEIKAEAPVVQSKPKKEEEKPVAAPAVTEAAKAAPTAQKPDAAFLAELKKKMTAMKAGEKPTFTAAEIAYIKALKEKQAKKAASAAEKPQTEAVQNIAQKPQSASVPADRTASAGEAVPESEKKEKTDIRFSADQIARLRALRAKQLEEEKRKENEDTKEIKQIKCPACAVFNPETNESCYICRTPLK